MELATSFNTRARWSNEAFIHSRDIWKDRLATAAWSEKFKPITVNDLNLLKTEYVMEEIKKVLN